MDGEISFDVLFGGNPLPITLPLGATVLDLKDMLEMYTNVPVQRQMLLNLVDNKDQTQLASMDLSGVEMVEVENNEQQQQQQPAAIDPPVIPQPPPPMMVDDVDDVGQDDMLIDPPNIVGGNNNNNINNQPFIDVDEDIDDDDDDADNQIFQNNRYATNYFPNNNYNDRISPHALTDFLDQLSYPAFSNDIFNEFKILVPQTFEGSYKEALSQAKRTGKLVLTYLYDPNNPDYTSFCFDVLQTNEVFEYVKNNYVFWVGTVDTDSLIFLVNLMPSFETLPIISIVHNAGGTPQVLQLLQGETDKDIIYNHLVTEYSTKMAELNRVKAEEEEKESQRRIVEEQDLAYEEALRADKEKARKEEEEKRRVEEEEKQVQNKKEQKLGRMALVPPEPAKGPEATHIIFKLPDDSKIERRFNSTDTLQTLSDFLDGSGVDFEGYQFITMYPKKVYTKKEYNLTLKETGIHPQSILNVRDESD
ncbi:ubiquitin domain-containing protein [Heterostelium album PN500]|uniref:Ubiquitin domain-containing protein n=1 Tax=Heterostelium pallidum (strain ATCC 26659 / Pp 5 / PN500) TaxID=670386 RepID=D3B613_HETP5|nr:ubiquitin domain-containing protein [Heterostelium album PN500]EFA83311.1 ubiquitin domain-containing protein [Heterostelium album PN500]|eukprot:XP_020435428.1 ubiquitin domain-containing protein [Heterostelium album PN500]